MAPIAGSFSKHWPWGFLEERRSLRNSSRNSLRNSGHQTVIGFRRFDRIGFWTDWALRPICKRTGKFSKSKWLFSSLKKTRLSDSAGWWSYCDQIAWFNSVITLWSDWFTKQWNPTALSNCEMQPRSHCAIQRQSNGNLTAIRLCVLADWNWMVSSKIQWMSNWVA